jgi:glycosyltransferase involved in cell wall biosynthesis
MNREPLVSVIMIFLDGERFIEEAVESVLAQTYTRWELLFVDDGSHDASTRIARRYVQKFPEQMRYLEHAGHANCGMSASRNLAIQQAHGEFIAFLDADDVWLQQKLERQVATLRAQPEAAMVYGPTTEWFSWDERREDGQSDFIQDLGITPNTLIAPAKLVSLTLEQEGRSPRTCSVLLRREAVQAVGEFVTGFRGLYEDKAFFTKLCLRYPVFAMNESHDRYRQHNKSSCKVAVRSGQYHPARQRFLAWITEYMLKERIADSEVWKALKRERSRYRNRVLRRVRELLGAGIRAMRKVVPPPLRRWIGSKLRHEEYCPPVGWIFWGNLRRLKPFSANYGFERGQPVDRYYIERFLAAHAADIRGRVLEIGDNTYTRQFGRDAVTRSDVLHVSAGSPKATIVADLTKAEEIPSQTFDCLIIIQTLQFIYDTRAALRTAHRILKPGGILLATIPGLSQHGHDEWQDHWFWSFTTKSARRLFEEFFARDCIEVAAHGNVLVTTAFLQGIATGELRRTELDHHDPDYEMLITVRAKKG